MERWYRVPADALVGDRGLVEIGGRTIALFRTNGDVHAFDNACPHEGNPLVDGDVLGPMLTCAARRYTAEIRDGAIWIALDDAA